ncbi:MAG: hypothetical protein AAFO07_33505 [Bacteroidota bacterium]
MKIEASLGNDWIFCIKSAEVSVYKNIKKIVSKSLQEDSPFAFYVTGTPFNYTFILDNKDRIIVAYSGREEVSFLSLDEFLKNHWNQFIPLKSDN